MDHTEFYLNTGESDRPYSKFYDNFLGKDNYVEYKKLDLLQVKQSGWFVSADNMW